MNLGQIRFDVQLQKIEHILQLANLEDDVVDCIYTQDIRTPMFMLEGLCRLYRHIHHPKKFEKLLNQCKLIEDLVGQYDYYVVLAKEITGTTSLHKKLLASIHEHKENCSKELYNTLVADKWLNGKRIAKWRKKLEEVSWLAPAKESKAIQKVYLQEVNKVNDYLHALPEQITDMELETHELRRKLRWLSIYCHGLNGSTQLIPSKNGEKIAYKEYFTDKIKASPYNQFDVAENVDYPLILNQEAFWGLSWMIAELGSIKDKGLHNESKMLLLEKLKVTAKEQLIIKVLEEQNHLEQTNMLAVCSKIIQEFKNYKVLKDLV